jgi:hypothetical protein
MIVVVKEEEPSFRGRLLRELGENELTFLSKSNPPLEI